MDIDWTATGSMLSGWGTLASAAAIAYAAHKAAETVTAWRSKKVAERQFEHAERTLKATMDACDALRHIRGAMILEHELHAAREELEKVPGFAGQTEQRQQNLVSAQTLVNRLKRTEGISGALDECRPLAAALFSEELEQAIARLHHQFWSVRTWIDALAEDTGDDRDFSMKIRQNLTDPQAQNESKVSVAIRESRETINNICLPVLRA